jgi:hypothetical protein
MIPWFFSSLSASRFKFADMLGPMVFDSVYPIPWISGILDRGLRVEGESA